MSRSQRAHRRRAASADAAGRLIVKPSARLQFSLDPMCQRRSDSINCSSVGRRWRRAERTPGRAPAVRAASSETPRATAASSDCARRRRQRVAKRSGPAADVRARVRVAVQHQPASRRPTLAPRTRARIRSARSSRTRFGNRWLVIASGWALPTINYRWQWWRSAHPHESDFRFLCRTDRYANVSADLSLRQTCLAALRARCWFPQRRRLRRCCGLSPGGGGPSAAPNGRRASRNVTSNKPGEHQRQAAP